MVVEVYPFGEGFGSDTWPEVGIICYDIDNIQTAEVERSLWLEDNPSSSPDNVQVTQYRE